MSRNDNKDADAVIAQLICVFVFAFAGCWFSQCGGSYDINAHTQQDFIFNRTRSDQSAHLRNETHSDVQKFIWLFSNENAHVIRELSYIYMQRFEMLRK